MKAAKFFTLMLAVPLLLQQGASGQTCPPAVPPFPMGTAFTYQGFLTFTNPGGQTSPVDDTCDFAFRLWDCEDGGGQVGPTLTFDGIGTNPPPIGVIEGHFTVQLDFGNEYDGDARFLEITVDCPPPFSGPVTLEPRQELTPVPYALFDGDWDITNTPDMFAVPTGNVGIGTATPTEKLDVAGNIHASGIIASGGAIWLDGTVTTLFDSVVTDTDFMELLVDTSQRALRLEANATSPNLIGGFSGNFVTAGVVGGTIGGGGRAVQGAPFENIVTDDFATVGGGERNTAGGPGATVGGGHWNTANGSWSAVGGGFRNTAGGGGWSTVGGGNLNIASGGAATVPGGESNVAAGLTSFAAGRLAHADHHGTFVWGDNTPAVFASTAANQFLIRAAGGVGIGTNDPNGYQLRVNGNVCITGNLCVAGAVNATGPITGGVCSSDCPRCCSSDRRLKDHIKPIAGGLDKVTRLCGVSFQWRRDEFPKMNFRDGQQIGLIAQEVAEVLPEVVVTNPDGYKAIQYGKVVAVLVEAIKQLDTTLGEKDAQIAALEARLTALENAIARTTQIGSGGEVR